MKQIDQALDLMPLPEKRAQNVLEITPNDYEYARGNMINIIEKGNEALSGILDVAGMSQHPRAYEVAATLMKNMAEINKDLLELKKRQKDIEASDPSQAKTINNNLFVGSTAELQQFLKRQNE